MRRQILDTDLASHSNLLNGIFRLRARVFKDRLDWRVRTQDGLERDKFDDLNPVYFASTDDSGEVDGTWRLLPTTGPTMLSEVFPFLLDGRPIPNSPFVWEMSRLALRYEKGRDGARVGHESCTVAVLFAAAMEFCWRIGVKELVVVHDHRMARITQRTLGYPATWETDRFDIDGTTTSAAQYRIDSPTAFRRRVGLLRNVLTFDDNVSADNVA